MNIFLLTWAILASLIAAFAIYGWKLAHEALVEALGK